MGGIVTKCTINKNINTENINGEECDICMENKKLVEAYPCKHKACISCFINGSMYSSKLLCFYCRKEIDYIKLDNKKLDLFLKNPSKLYQPSKKHSIDQGGLYELQQTTYERILTVKSTHNLVKIENKNYKGCTKCGIIYNDELVNLDGPNPLLECCGINNNNNFEIKKILIHKMLEQVIDKHINKYYINNSICIYCKNKKELMICMPCKHKYACLECLKKNTSKCKECNKRILYLKFSNTLLREFIKMNYGKLINTRLGYWVKNAHKKAIENRKRHISVVIDCKHCCVKCGSLYNNTNDYSDDYGPNYLSLCRSLKIDSNKPSFIIKRVKNARSKFLEGINQNISYI